MKTDKEVLTSNFTEKQFKSLNIIMDSLKGLSVSEAMEVLSTCRELIMIETIV